MREVSTGNPFCKDMPILPMVKVTTRRESVIHVQTMIMKKNLVKYRKSMIQKYTCEKVSEKKLQSIVNSIGEQSALLLMAVK